VEAGRALLQAIGYGRPDGNWLEVGVGICSGEEFVGNVGGGGFKDFTALGDVTNTAARLQSVARRGEILMCASTYRVVRERYPEAEQLQLQLKGKEARVQGFRLREAALPQSTVN
jgi:adenylate cyclase